MIIDIQGIFHLLFYKRYHNYPNKQVMGKVEPITVTMNKKGIKFVIVNLLSMLFYISVRYLHLD